MQAWCNLQVKLSDPCLSALEIITTMRCTNRRILYFTLSVHMHIHSQCQVHWCRACSEISYFSGRQKCWMLPCMICDRVTIIASEVTTLYLPSMVNVTAVYDSILVWWEVGIFARKTKATLLPT